MKHRLHFKSRILLKTMSHARKRTRGVMQNDVAAAQHVSHEVLCAAKMMRQRAGAMVLESTAALLIALLNLERASRSHSGSCPAPASDMQ